MTPPRAVPAAALALVVALAGCSGDDDEASTTASAAPTIGSTSAATSAATSSATPSPTPVDPVAETTPPIDPALTAPPPSSTTERGPTPSDELAAQLPGAGDLSLPDDWVQVDLDPHVVLDPALASDFDPFLGLVRCADGVLREGPEGTWAERRFTAPAAPADDGVVSIRVSLEREPATEHAADAEALAACTPANDQVVIAPSDGVLPDGSPVHRLAVSAAPTADVPFPSVFLYVVAHTGDTTATVLMYGLDVGQDWGPRAEQVVGRILDRSG